MRGKMRSPGQPPDWQRDPLQHLWAELAKGASSEVAAISVGVAPVVGTRWFRDAGGMRSISTKESVSPQTSLGYSEAQYLAVTPIQRAQVDVIHR